MKLMEQYKLSYIKSPKDNYDFYYNNLITKQPEHLTYGDIYFMIRQNVLPKVALSMMIKVLVSDPLAGEMYPVQFFEILNDELDKSASIDINVLLDLESRFETFNATNKWDDEDDMRDFTKQLNRLKKTMASYL